MEDLKSKRYGQLTVVEKVKNRRSAWLCKCDCGNTVVLTTFYITKAGRKSCGCLNIQNRGNIGQRSKTHGSTNTKLYKIWCGMKERCHNPNYEYYARYGGRGIKICEEWNNSFSAFQKWAYDNGYDPALSGRVQSIDRINTDGDYCPDNCKWSTQKEQVRNRSNSVNMIADGQIVNPYEFCEKHNITDRVFVYRRLKKGESAEKILHDWNMLHNTPKGYMSVEDAIQFYNVCDCTIKHWIYNGKLKAEKVGNKWFIPKGQTVMKLDDRDSKGRFLPKR